MHPLKQVTFLEIASLDQVSVEPADGEARRVFWAPNIACQDFDFYPTHQQGSVSDAFFPSPPANPARRFLQRLADLAQMTVVSFELHPLRQQRRAMHFGFP